MDILTLGNKIKNRRKELGLTLKELAGDRVTPAQLSYVETDKCKPSLDLLEYVAERLGLEMDYLLESEKKQVSRFCEYNIKVCQIDIFRHNYIEAKNRVRQVLDISKTYGLNYFLGESEKYIGIICKHLNEYEDADNHYLNALHEFSRIDNYKRITEVYTLLGLTAYDRKYYSSAVGYFIQAERFIKDSQEIDILFKLKIYYYICQAYQILKDNEKLNYYIDKLSTILELFDDKDRYGEELYVIAMEMENENKYDSALEYVSRSLHIFDHLDAIKFISKVETDLGRIMANINMSSKSFEHLNKALEIKKLIGDSSIHLTLMEIAQNYINSKDYENAFKTINEALNIAIRTGNREYESLTYHKLFKVFNEKGDYIKAEESIRRYADILEYTNKYKELSDCYLEMGEFYKNINREKEALDYITKSIHLSKELFVSSL